MIFTGKLLGAIFGYWAGGLIGAIVGVIAGHLLIDARVRAMANPFGSNPKQARETFFRSSFQVMGHVAKADGRVSQHEIAAAEMVMARMRLDSTQRQRAIRHFEAGKSPDFDLNAEIARLKRDCGQASNPLRFFLEMQLQVAAADGEIDPAEERVLLNIGQLLGMSTDEMRRLLNFIRAQTRFSSGGQSSSSAGRRQAGPDQLQAAYDVLGVQANATDAEVKRAYRKLMSQHHPDKLSARGLPPEMMKVAEEKSQQITAAYDTIKQARKSA